MEKRRLANEPSPLFISNEPETDYNEEKAAARRAEFLNRLISYRNIIISAMADKERVSSKWLCRFIPKRILRKELEILKYYGVVKMLGSCLTKGENYGKIDVTSLPLPCLLNRLKPYEKVIYEIIKRKDCYSIDDITYTLIAYNIPCSHASVRNTLHDKFLPYGIVYKEKIEFGIHVYRIGINLFIPPPEFEDKIKEAIAYREEWERKHPNRVKNMKISLRNIEELDDIYEW